MGWTDERTDKLRRLWAEGVPAREIANTIGGVTKNAVIGKARRLGLEARDPCLATAKYNVNRARSPRQVWSDELTAACYQLYVVQGHSSAEVAAQLGIPGGGQAVARKSYIMGWGAARKAAKPTRAHPCMVFGQPGEKAKARARKRDSTATMRLAEIDSPNARPWTERRFGECAFPVSGEGADTHSCCNRATPGDPYCAPHRAVMGGGVIRKPAPMNRTALPFEYWRGAA